MSFFPFLCLFGLADACFHQYGEYRQGNNSNENQHDAHHLLCSLASVLKAGVLKEIVRLLQRQDVGYQGCCPARAFALYSAAAQSGCANYFFFYHQ